MLCFNNEYYVRVYLNKIWRNARSQCFLISKELKRMFCLAKKFLRNKNPLIKRKGNQMNFGWNINSFKRNIIMRKIYEFCWVLIESINCYPPFFGMLIFLSGAVVFEQMSQDTTRNLIQSEKIQEFCFKVVQKWPILISKNIAYWKIFLVKKTWVKIHFGHIIAIMQKQGLLWHQKLIGKGLFDLLMIIWVFGSFRQISHQKLS